MFSMRQFLSKFIKLYANEMLNNPEIERTSAGTEDRHGRAAAATAPAAAAFFDV